MREQIQVGDLVQVVAPTHCCGDPRYLGYVYRVLSFCRQGDTYCSICGKDSPGSVDAMDDDESGHDVRTLKRIPPLSELEGEKRDEEITA